jgi:hypothetical protein
VTYDYLGYGETPGVPTEYSTILIASSVYDEVVSLYPDSKIICWGRSIGSVPTCYLGATREPDLVILESAMATGFNVVFKKPMCGCAGALDNLTYIK